MRMPSLLGSTPFLSRTIWLVSLVAIFANAITFNSIPQPSLDLSSLGRVGIAGDFSGVSIYEFEGQTEASPFSNGSQSLLSRLPNGIFTTLASSDAQIQALCVHELSDGTIKGIFVGGNFTGLGNLPANGVALFNPDDGSIVALDGLIGKVHALLCDKATNTVYVGGDFSGSNSSNAIAWVDSKGWTDLPFDGFNGPVKTISRSPNNRITFGGEFTSLGNSSLPIVKHAQTVNLVSTNITAEETTDVVGFNDPTSVVCSTGTDSQWLLRDGQRGSWTANFKFGFIPTKLQLRNANFEGRGTKLFRFTAFPLNGIMNLTYVDSQTNQTKFCDAWCELANETAPQDFLFVNNVGMNSIRIDILEHYGAAGGLAGIELFQDDIFAFASPDLNEPTCVSAAARSSSTVTGQWTEIDSPEVDSEYLSTSLDAAQLPSAAIVFEPHIQQSGEYTVLVFTPGCRQDNSCNSRGQVNITGTYTKDGLAATPTQFFQTNDFDKYDTVYRGFVDASDGSFRPSVTLTPSSSQSLAVVNIVAQKVQFQLFSNVTGGSDGTSVGNLSSLSLNGLYEFNPKQTNTPTAEDIDSSIISTAGRQLDSGAIVNILALKGDTTYVGGNFSAQDGSFEHFFAIGPDGPITPSKGGLNNTVYSMLLVDDLLYLGGLFQNTITDLTTGLGFVASYNTQSREWQALGAGVNGRVMDIVSLSVNISSGTENAIAFSGDFTRIEPSGGSGAVDVNGFAVWVPSQNQWLERLPGDTIAIGGVLSAAVSLPGSSNLYAGSIASQSLSASGAISLSSTDTALALQAFQMEIQETTAATQRRRTVVPGGYEGVVTGVFYVPERGGQNLTVLGGHFTAQGKDGTINNLLVINGAANDEITGFGSEIESTGTVLTLSIVDSLLFIGGSFTGKVNGDISGLVIWDFSNNAFASIQPVGLEGNEVKVLAVSQRPGTEDIYVAGSFTSAGSLPCPSVCIFDNTAKQWGSMGGDVSGQVDVLVWLDSDILLVAGDMTLNNTAAYIAIYNAKSNVWQAHPGDITNIPGPIQSVTFDSAAKNSFFISGVTASDGSAYLMKYGTNKFVQLEGLGGTTLIRNIQILNLNSEHSATDTMDASQSLLVLGSLDIPNFGNASAALYDGTNWTPFLLTSKASGAPGSISSLFSEKMQTFGTPGKKLAKGFVILISLAIALGLVFLLVVLGVLASYIRRRREGYTPAPTRASPVQQSMQMQDRLPPSQLFGSVGPNSVRPGPML